MKLLALDIGDVWVGTALSDAAGIICKPYRTTKLENLDSFLQEVLANEYVRKVVVGHPVTVGGNKSEQTKSIETLFDQLKEKFAAVSGEAVTWILWDERFSTKRAQQTMGGRRARKKESKTEEHSIAAAFILQSYLDYKAIHGET